VANSGLTRIDLLFEGAGAAHPIGRGDPDKETVGAIQDLLRGHGHASMPSPLGADYGLFGDKTKVAVANFRAGNGLPSADVVDGGMMKALILTPAEKPIASRPYVTLALDLEWTGLTKIALLTSLLEGQGLFGAVNRNTDKAGLSYGIIQWAQKPGRLHGILEAFQSADGGAFTKIFGDGDAAVASGLLSHTALPNGGVDASGRSTNEAFDLTSDAWIARFEAATLAPAFQKAQVNAAAAAFQNSLSLLKAYAPELTTERELAFMLDLANQFGDAGAKSLYRATAQRAMPSANRLMAIADRSVDRMPAEFQAGTRNRRMLFITTSLLADSSL
jgi:hypothetical protein